MSVTSHAGSHGTEYASTVALTRLIPRIDPKTLAGTVIIAPLLTIASFEQMTVHTNPIDKKGMNRLYPGDAAGTQTHRVLALVALQIVKPSDVIIDLHGGDLDEDSSRTATGSVPEIRSRMRRHARSLSLSASTASSSTTSMSRTLPAHEVSAATLCHSARP